jgi:flagella basal body P-ring formation protein FlgA
VAAGQPFEYRGVILNKDVDVRGLESRQTILEGQFVTSTAVQRVPDVRRGDAVRIHLVSEGLSLVTTGAADEPGFLDGQVRVITSKSKRQLVGRLQRDSVVEVRL